MDEIVMLEKITENPFVNLLSGIILFVTSGYEVWVSLDEFALGAHHGVLIFGIFHVIKTLPEFLYALKEFKEGEDGFKNQYKN